MLDQINVNAYGSLMPLNQVSNVSVPDARMLLVSVWDNSLVSVVEKSIKESPLGLNPMVEGNVIRISIPPLSEERRIEITKIAAKYAENARIAVRNIRREYIETVRKLQKNAEISEDQKHNNETSIQHITDEIIRNIDNILSLKEKEILEKLIMSLNHLAIIMDGNRRWASSNNLKSFEGHIKGADNLWQIVKDVKKKINYLTVFVFSTENWKGLRLRYLSLWILLVKFLDDTIEKLIQMITELGSLVI